MGCPVATQRATFLISSALGTPMQLKHLRQLRAAAGDDAPRVTALAWSPNGRRFALVTADRVIYLYDESGEKKDKASVTLAALRAGRGARGRGDCKGRRAETGPPVLPREGRGRGGAACDVYGAGRDPS